MLGLLCAMKTETIIGIVAIIVIVISVGIIVATAVRNFLLHKKMVGSNDIDNAFAEDNVQEIDENSVTNDAVAEDHPVITTQDEEEHSKIDGIKSEFADGEEEEVEVVQEIELVDTKELPDESQTQIVVDDLKSAAIDNTDMAQLEEKLTK